MKREKIYCLLSAFVLSILFIIFTLESTSIDVDAILIYFALTSAVLVSILAFIKIKKSKANQYGLLATIEALMAILSFIFAMFGIIQSIKNIAYIPFACWYFNNTFKNNSQTD